MSHSFSVNINQAMTIDQISQEAGISDLSFVSGYSESKDGLWPEELSYFYRDQVSVRTIESEHFGSRINIRIFAASSPEDYDLAIKITTAIARIQNEKITSEDSDEDELALADFLSQHDSAWVEQHAKTMFDMTLGGAIERPDSVSSISGVHVTMKIGKRVASQLVQSGPNAAAEYYERFRTLNYINDLDVYQGSTMIVGNEAGDKNVRKTTYTEGVKTLLVDKNTLVALIGDDRLHNENEAPIVLVPLAALPELVGEGAAWLSENLLLLPSVTGDVWKAFHQRAKKVSVSDIFDYSYDPQNDPFASENAETQMATGGVSDLSDTDFETLAYAPVIVFCMVAAADGEVDQQESEAFQMELLKGLGQENEVMQRMLVATISEGTEIFEKVVKQEVDVMETLKQCVSILESKLSEQEAMQCKVELLKIGKSIAEASGGFLGRFGSKISKEEKRALTALGVMLGLV